MVGVQVFTVIFSIAGLIGILLRHPKNRKKLEFLLPLLITFSTIVISLLFFIPLSFQRYYLPVYTFLCLFSADVIQTFVNGIKNRTEKLNNTVLSNHREDCLFFDLVSPGINFCPLCSITNCRVIRIISMPLAGMSSLIFCIKRCPISSSLSRPARPRTSSLNGPNGFPIFTRTFALRPKRKGKTSLTPSRPTGRIRAEDRAAKRAAPGRAGRNTEAQLPASGKIPSTPLYLILVLRCKTRLWIPILDEL